MTRWFLLLVLALAPVAAPAATRSYSVTDFDRIVVEGPYQVRLATGRSSQARATGSPDALDRLSVDVQGQTLRIRRNRNHWGGNPNAPSGVITLELTTRNLRSARVIGPGSLDIEGAKGLRVDLAVEGSGRLRVGSIDADTLSVGLAGDGIIDLAGRAESITADIQGSGTLAAANLSVENARIISATSGTVSLAVAEEADVRALGLGNVLITGRPSCNIQGPNGGNVSCGGPAR